MTTDMTMMMMSKMSRTLTQWWFLVFVLCSYTNFVVQANDGYLISHSLMFRPGVAERLSVTIFEPTEDIKVQARLLWLDEVVAETEKYIYGKGFLTLEVPVHLYGRAKIEVCGNCELGATGFHFKNATIVDVATKSSSVFIQVDKPVYKPGQQVHMNFIMTGPDLKPKEEEMVAYILDPAGSRMIQWKNLQSICCGIINMTFPLSDQPVLGEWTIFAELRTQTFNKSFEVKKYVLPRFEVLIDPPSYIRDIDSCEMATVTARYTYGKPVHGKLSINMNIHGLGYYDNYIGQNNYMFLDIHGTASFEICVTDLLSSMLKSHFRGMVRIEASVTSNDGNAFTAVDESCLVHRQLVMLKFSDDTREHYKPGLPYFGKAELTFPDGSPADDVTVRVRAEVNEEVLYTQDYSSINGIVEFDIPTLPVGSGLVWLDARVMSIQGTDVSDSYFSTYQSLGSWYSPSHCHILLRNLQPGLKVGDSAMIGILSTCPCNFTYHYEVMSRGNILTSGSHRAFQSYNRNKRNHEPAAERLIWDDVINKNATIPAPVDHCETVFTFEVTHAMIPLSRVMVFYKMDDTDEGVADSIKIPVEPSFENQVKVRLTRNTTIPGHKLSMAVSAKPGSCICLASVDRSVQLLRPGYQLTPEKIFQEMEDYDVTATVHEDTRWWHIGGLKKRKRRSTLWRTMKSRDANYAFKEAGLKVMTDRVNLIFPEHDLSIKGGGHWMEQQGPGSYLAEHRLDRRRRAYFPDTWMFQCFNLSDTRKEESIHVHTPDTITTWVTDVLAFSKTHGLGVAQPVSLTTFKDFFIEFTLPYSVIRGEQLRVPVTVYNYMDFCVQISLNIHLQDGIRFLGDNSRSQAKKLCLEAGEVLTTHVVLVFSELGKMKIHAGAEAYSSPNCCEGPVSEESVVAVDKISQSILVEAEGISRGYAYSVFFCPNERIHISTPNRYEYQFVKKPSTMEFLTFLCKAKNDATIGLARNHDAHELYEIVLGGWDNTISWIARSRMGDQLVIENTPNIMSWDEFRAFWITWDDGELKVGYGEVPTNDSVILTLVDDNPLPIEYIGFTTGMGSIGEFRIWRKEEDDEAYSEAFTLTLPLNFVPGSERAVATIIGDVMGPTLNNLHNLIKLPFGCGEQNMIHFAPIVYVIGYLQRTNQLNPETDVEAKSFLVKGYQRQLTYKRYDGSYSAFGQSDSSGSMWLTAFVLKSFSKSLAFIYIDPKELEESKLWIIAHQEVDGSFPPIGRVLNKDIQGGIQGKVSLTAYVLVALLETGLETPEEERAVETAQQFLEDHIESVIDPYTAALVAYALTVQSSISAQFAVRILSNMAIRKEGLTYWRLSGEPLENLPFYMLDTDIEQTVTSAEVEMTAYALLTFTAMGDIAYSLPIVKWLTQQRNSLGGFSSTQDTCVALQALSEYATLAYVGHVNLNISLAYSSMASLVEQYYHLNNENSQVLQVIEIPVLSKTPLFLRAFGEGCGLMQIDVDYNIPDPTNKPSFKLNVNLLEEDEKAEADFLEGLFPPGRKRRSSGGEINNDLTSNNYKIVIETCTRWLHAGSSNMAVLEVSLLSGFTAGVESLERLLLDKHSKVKRYELKGRQVILYFDEIPSQCMSCIRFDAYREHAVGKLTSVPVKVYDYYEPHFEATKFYNVSRDSPLSGELCEEDRECNQVDDQDRAPQPAPPNPGADLLANLGLPINPEQCNSLRGNCITPADMVQCVCERTCQYGGSKVCGSDGVIYENYCMLEVAACQMNTNIQAMPINYCPEPTTTMETPQLEVDGSGSVWPDWSEWPFTTDESLVRNTLPTTPPSTPPTSSGTNLPQSVPSGPEAPGTNLPVKELLTLPPVPVSSTSDVADTDAEMVINTNETMSLNEQEQEVVDAAEQTLPLSGPKTTSSPVVPQDIPQDFPHDVINETHISNVTTNPQTQTVVFDHEHHEPELVDNDNERTETGGHIAQDAVDETVVKGDEADTAEPSEKVISSANARLEQMHEANAHDKLANEVLIDIEEEEAEEPTQLTDHGTSQTASHVTSNVDHMTSVETDMEDPTTTDKVKTQSMNGVISSNQTIPHSNERSPEIAIDEIVSADNTSQLANDTYPENDLENVPSSNRSETANGQLVVNETNEAPPVIPEGEQIDLYQSQTDTTATKTEASTTLPPISSDAPVDTSQDQKDESYTSKQQEHNQTYLIDSNPQPFHQDDIRATIPPLPQEELTGHKNGGQIHPDQMQDFENTAWEDGQMAVDTDEGTIQEVDKEYDVNLEDGVHLGEDDAPFEDVFEPVTMSMDDAVKDVQTTLESDDLDAEEFHQNIEDHTVKPSSSESDMKTEAQKTVYPTKAAEETATVTHWTTNQTILSNQSYPDNPDTQNDSDSANKSHADMEPTNQEPAEIQPTNQSDIYLKQSNQSHFDTRLPDLKPSDIVPSTDIAPPDVVSEDATSTPLRSKDAHVNETQQPTSGKEADMVSLETPDNVEQPIKPDEDGAPGYPEEHWPLFDNPFTDLDTMVNDQGVPETDVAEDHLSQDKDPKQEER